jgi:hypothetical protein
LLQKNKAADGIGGHSARVVEVKLPVELWQFSTALTTESRKRQGEKLGRRTDFAQRQINSLQAPFPAQNR